MKRLSNWFKKSKAPPSSSLPAAAEAGTGSKVVELEKSNKSKYYDGSLSQPSPTNNSSANEEKVNDKANNTAQANTEAVVAAVLDMKSNGEVAMSTYIDTKNKSNENDATATTDIGATKSTELATGGDDSVNAKGEKESVKQVVVEEQVTNFNEDDFPLYGVSIDYIHDLFNSDIYKPLIEKDGSTSDSTAALLEFTKEKETSLAEMLLSNENTKHHAKKLADVFISHAWSYKLKDVLASLLILKEKSKSDLHVWMDVFSVNQHKSKKKEYDTNFWKNTFHNALSKIGKACVILTPIENPLPLTRSWCVWEMYGCVMKHVDVQVVVPPSELEKLYANILEDPVLVVKRFSKVDIKNARAFYKEDEKMILDAAESAEGGLIVVQNIAVEPLRNYIADVAFDTYQQIYKPEVSESGQKSGLTPNQISNAFTQLALLLGELGRYEREETVFRSICEILIKNQLKETTNYASALQKVGESLRKQGKIVEAMGLLNEAQAMFDILNNSDSWQYAEILNNTGATYSAKGEYDKAIETHKLCLQMRLRLAGTDKHPHVALSLNNLGVTSKKAGKFDEAKEYYRQSLEIYEYLNSPELTSVSGKNYDADVALLSVNLGSLLMNMKKYNEALPLLRKGLEMDRRIYGDNHADVATDFNNVGLCLYYMDNKSKEADEMGRMCVLIRKRIFGKDHEATQRAIKSWGDFKE